VSADGVRLVVDLLLHEGGVAALLGGRGVPGDLVGLALGGVPSKLIDDAPSGVIVTIWSWAELERVPGVADEAPRRRLPR
jgi:hypothetical protein